jgi:CheY-like chemotaxis protein
VDILLTDVGLPGVSGLQLAREARARRPGLCLVLATGDGRARSEAELLNAALIVKPYTRDTLRQALEHALKAQRMGS